MAEAPPAPADGAASEHSGGSSGSSPAEADAASSHQPRRRALAAGAAATVSYLALALLAYWPVQPFSTTSVVSCGCYDVAEQMWFLSWTPHAIAHLMNPFFTNALDVPAGANLAANTTMPLLGLLASPITFGLGPVAAYNVLVRLALFSSALSMCLVLRHYRRRWPVAFLGGLVYGFSPYELTQASLHLNLSFVPLLPLVVVAIDELVVRRRHSARRAGLTLGALATAQYFVSSELLADLGVLAAVAVVLLAARHPREALARAGRVASGVAWALVPFVLLAGYPIAFGILGPQHYVRYQPIVTGNEQIRDDLLSPVVPTSLQLLSPGRWARLGDGLVTSGVAENGGYLGIPLACCWLATLVWAVLRRRGRTLLFAVLAAVAFVLSLGPSLQVHGVDRGIRLPFALFEHVPLLEVAVPARFAALVAMAVVLSVTASLDALWTRLEAVRGRWARSGGVAATGALLAAVLVPLLPAHPLASAPVDVPSLFGTAAVRSIPSGSAVLVYPYPLEQDDFSMVWQAESGFGFRLLGGYVLTPPQTRPLPSAGPGGADLPPTLSPTIVQVLFYAATTTRLYSQSPTLQAVLPKDGSRRLLAGWVPGQVEAFLRDYHVGTVVLDPQRFPAPAAARSPVLHESGYGPDHLPGAVDAVFRQMFGHPVHVGPLLVWYHADTRPLAGRYRHRSATRPRGAATAGTARRGAAAASAAGTRSRHGGRARA